jgi:hypothetical protein
LGEKRKNRQRDKIKGKWGKNIDDFRALLAPWNASSDLYKKSGGRG